MLPNLTAPLRKALSQLETEKQRIDREMVNIRAALQALQRRGQPARQGNHGSSARGTAKGQMSTAQRQAVSRAMKKYWAKRKAKESQRPTAKAA